MGFGLLRLGVSGLVVAVVIGLLLVAVVGTFVYWRAGVGSAEATVSRNVGRLALGVREGLVLYLNGTGVWARPTVGSPRIVAYGYVYADGRVAWHATNILLTGPKYVAPYDPDAKDFVVRTQAGIIYHLTQISNTTAVTGNTGLGYVSIVTSPQQLNAIVVPSTRIPVDTAWTVNFYGTTSTSISKATFSKDPIHSFPDAVPVVVKYVWSKPINVGYTVTGNTVTVSVTPNATAPPPEPLIGSGILNGTFKVYVGSDPYYASTAWVVKNVTLGRNGDATLTIKVGYWWPQPSGVWFVKTYDLRAGDRIPNPYFSNVAWIAVYVDGALLKSWGGAYSTDVVSGYLRNLLVTYIFGTCPNNIPGFYRIGGVYRAYYAFAGSRFGDLVHVVGAMRIELSPTYWKTAFRNVWGFPEWAELKRLAVGWGMGSLNPSSPAWGDVGLPVSNCTVINNVPDYYLRANVTILDAGSNVIKRYWNVRLGYVGNLYGLPVFTAIVRVPVFIIGPYAVGDPGSGHYVLASVYNISSGEVLWNATQFMAFPSVSLVGMLFRPAFVKYYLAGVDFSNYTLVGFGSLTVNGYTAVIHDTGARYAYVGHSYKVLDVQDFARFPSLRIETHFIQLTTPTRTITSTTTTTTTAPPPPPTPTGWVKLRGVVLNPLATATKPKTVTATIMLWGHGRKAIPTPEKDAITARVVYYRLDLSNGSVEWVPYATSTITDFYYPVVDGVTLVDTVTAKFVIPGGEYRFAQVGVSVVYNGVTSVVGYANAPNWAGTPTTTAVVTTTTKTGTTTIIVTSTTTVTITYPRSGALSAPWVGAVVAVFLPGAVFAVALLRGRGRVLRVPGARWLAVLRGSVGRKVLPFVAVVVALLSRLFG